MELLFQLYHTATAAAAQLPKSKQAQLSEDYDFPRRETMLKRCAVWRDVVHEWENVGCVNGKEDDYGWCRERDERLREASLRLQAAGVRVAEGDEEKEVEIGVDPEVEAREDDEEEEYSLRRQGLYKPLIGSRNMFNVRSLCTAEFGIVTLISELIGHLSFLKLLDSSLSWHLFCLTLILLRFLLLFSLPSQISQVLLFLALCLPLGFNVKTSQKPEKRSTTECSDFDHTFLFIFYSLVFFSHLHFPVPFTLSG
jgi:hypothetical protein